MHHSLVIVQLFRILAILAAMQITSASLNADKPSAKSSPPSPASGGNPLLVESTLPYHAPPFDKIKDEHFVPAIEAGMREQLKEVDTIAASSEKPTFDNTIVALERTGRLLDRAERTFSNLNAADTNPTRQKIDTEIAPKLSAHNDTIHLNGKLFARIQELYSNRDNQARNFPNPIRRSSKRSMASLRACRRSSSRMF